MYHVQLSFNAVAEDPPCVFESPKDTVAFLEPAENITVTCNISGDFVHWNVNGTPLNEYNKNNNNSLNSTHGLVGPGISLCSLYIPAKAKYNETVVGCVDLSSNCESQNATILIQGTITIMHIFFSFTGHRE